jgi:hypothetical protein
MSHRRKPIRAVIVFLTLRKRDWYSWRAGARPLPATSATDSCPHLPIFVFPRFDGLTWPHYDGLIWPHPRPAPFREPDRV